MKRSVILTDPLDPDILLVLRMKGQVLHRERAHLKVNKLMSVFHASVLLLTMNFVITLSK